MPAFNLLVVYDIEASFPVLSLFWLKLQYKKDGQVTTIRLSAVITRASRRSSQILAAASEPSW